MSAACTPAQRVGIFLAGVQKAGTTSLHAYLADHGALAAPRVKETHFFDDESLDWDAPPYETFHAFFAAAPAGAQAFDATPIYSFWPPSLGRIRRYNADARLIMAFRDPIERAYSHWAMERRRGAETLPFAEAIRAGRARLPQASPLRPEWRVYSYVERGFYAAQVRHALALFPRSQLLFLDAAELRRSHADVLGRIAAFLGLDPFSPLPARLEHVAPPGPGPEADDIAYLRSLFAGEVEDLASLTGLDLGDWLTLRGS